MSTAPPSETGNSDNKAADTSLGVRELRDTRLSATRLSAVVTTFNNAETLGRCLQSIRFADEILVLDSFSTDASCKIAEQHGARLIQGEFLGYGPQKAKAIAAATHCWVLLLDADEWLPESSALALRSWLDAPDADGVRLPRIERMFWRYAHPRARANTFLRLFQRDSVRMSDSRIHAAPEIKGKVRTLAIPFIHEGEPNIHTKVSKINHYSTGLAVDYADRSWLHLRMLFDPPWMFFKSYVLRRQCLSGWAGLIHSVSQAYYAFLRYAKAIEKRQKSVEWE